MSGKVHLSPAELVDAQIEAYNDHDLERFCSFFAEDVEIGRLGQDRGLLSGKDALAARYSARFAETPDVHCTIDRRIALGTFVIDAERLINTGPDERHVIALYQVEGGRIRRVWFVEG